MIHSNTSKMLTFSNIIIVSAAVTTALISGLFYAWSCAVIPGLSKVSDHTYLESMQQINRAILNPVFFMSFIGAALLLPLCTYIQYSPTFNARFWLLLSATIIYLTGTFGVTAFGNVPLNDMLDQFPLTTASLQDIARMRARFEQPWVYLHTIRTVAGVITLVLVIVACLCPAPATAPIASLARS